MGIGAFDTTHPLSMRMLGMHGAAFANYAVDDCDFLFALGSRFDDRVAGNPPKFAPNARRIAQIDIDASEINKVKPVSWSHVGLLPEALRALLAYGRRSGFKRDWSAWHAHLHDAASARTPMNYDRDSTLIQPYYVIEEINKLTRGEAIIATGVGQHQMWAAQYFDFRAPRLWLTSGSMGTMGFGLPAAIGAQLAHPDRLVIDIDGDASIRMNLGELETVTTYDLPVKVVVLNNFGDGMVKQWQKLFFKGRLSASDKSLHKKDFVKAAQADGFRYAVRLERKEDVRARRRRVHRLPGPGVPRSHDRSRRRRLPDGRARPGLRRDDHRRSHHRAPRQHDPSAGRFGNVLMGCQPRRTAREGPFWDAMEGRRPPPPAAVTLGFKLLEIDPARGTIRVQFEGEARVPESAWASCRAASSRRCSTTHSAPRWSVRCRPVISRRRSS